MTPLTMMLLPDWLLEPIQVVHVDDAGAAQAETTDMTAIRSGEDGRDFMGLRRYETIELEDQHSADLLSRRVVIEAVAKRGDAAPGVPAWVRATTALHPDRQDLSSWLSAARGNPTAPWVSHLPLLLRDAARSRGKDDYLLAMSDRAFLAASADDHDRALTALAPALSGPAYEIDRFGHRTGVKLPTINLKSRAVVTRAQAVLAEALLGSLNDGQLPTPATMREGWVIIVAQQHAGRLHQEDETTFAAPLAILDIHRSGREASLILSTLRISFAAGAGDIWLTYHGACVLHGAQALQRDVLALLADPGEQPSADREAVFAAVQERDLPILTLSSTADGQIVDLSPSAWVEGATPLLQDPPEFAFPDAVRALLHFRDDRDRAGAGASGWLARLIARRRPSGVQTAAKPPPSAPEANGRQAQPGSTSTSGTGSAPEKDRVGDHGNALDRAAINGSDAPPDAPSEEQPEDAPRQVDAAGGSERSEHDGGEAQTDTDGDGSGNAARLASKVQAELVSEPSASLEQGSGGMDFSSAINSAAKVAEGVANDIDAQAGAAQQKPEAAAPEALEEPKTASHLVSNGDGTSEVEAEADTQVAKSDDTPSSAAAPGSEKGHAGDAVNAHAQSEQDRDVRKQGLLKELFDSLDETDKAVIEKVRRVVSDKKKAGGLVNVVSHDDLTAHWSVAAVAYDNFHNKLLHSKSKDARRKIASVQQLLVRGSRWGKALFALAMVEVIRDAGVDNGIWFNMDQFRRAFDNAEAQAECVSYNLFFSSSSSGPDSNANLGNRQ